MKKNLRIAVFIFFVVVILATMVYFLVTNEDTGSDDKTIATIDDIEKLSSIVSFRLVPDEEILTYVKLAPDVRGEVPESFTNKMYDCLVFEIIYKTVDNAEVLGLISAPKDYLDQKYPVLIYNRGSANSISYYPKYAMFSDNINLTDYDFITIQSYYRDEDRKIEGAKYDQFGGDDINDILYLIDLAKLLNFTNDKLYMMGVSRGGLSTYLALSMEDRIDAAVSVAGVSDMTDLFHVRKELQTILAELFGGTPDEKPDEYEKRSAVCWANEINTPLLLLHGTNDFIVPVSQSETLYQKMLDYGKNVDLITYGGVGHVPTAKIFEDTMNWFSKY